MPVEDLHATIYHALGIPPDTSYVVEKRPVSVTTREGVGKRVPCSAQERTAPVESSVPFVLCVRQ